ncbi:Uncharacterised protein [Vibrio cholerae]|nr:Uncharacterised protein [Vibrio cholerae]
MPQRKLHSQRAFIRPLKQAAINQQRLPIGSQFMA